MAGPKPTRTERHMRWVKNNPVLSLLIAFGAGVIALAAFLQAGEKVVSFTKVALGRDPTRHLPTQAAFDVWAVEFRNAHQADSDPPPAVPTSETPEFQKANQQAYSVYSDFVGQLRNALVAYRREGHPNIYIDIPDFPKTIFGPEAAGYVGAAVFSRYSSWRVHVREIDPRRTRTGPGVIIESMSGDGMTRGGSGTGWLQMHYDFDSQRVQLQTGLGLNLPPDIPLQFPASSSRPVFIALAKHLVEKEIMQMRQNPTQLQDVRREAPGATSN